MKDIDRLGTEAWIIDDSKITKIFIVGIREVTELNTGSDLHGRTLPTKVWFRDHKSGDWIKKEFIYFNKEDIIKDLE
jgi:hypothetical protein